MNRHFLNFLATAAAIILTTSAHAQSYRQNCHALGSTVICDTVDNFGNVLQRQQCYRNGSALRCDGQSFPNGNPYAEVPMNLPPSSVPFGQNYIGNARLPSAVPF